MKRFELWLDESGDFEKDDSQKKAKAVPSLIGGLLTENSSFPDSAVGTIIPEEYYHSIDHADQLERFRRIDEKLSKRTENRFVVFSNQERVNIVDNNLTYLNIIAEGILQLLKSLKARYGTVFLRVLIANRVDTTTGRDYSSSVVSVGEYEKRLNEKMVLASLENSISSQEWELRTASARKDKRLMLADIVCNTFFTRQRKNKFDQQERAYIESIYTDSERTLVFTVFESFSEKLFRNDLLNGHIGEAVSNICLCAEEDVLERCFSLLKQRMKESGPSDLRLQYRFVSAYVEYYMNVDRDFDLCSRLLTNLLKYYIPLLKEEGGKEILEDANRLELDLRFYLMTTYTHTGNIEGAAALEHECREAVEQLPPTLDTVSYKIRFAHRNVINLINMFDFESALLEVDAIIDRCAEVEELLGLVCPDREIAYEEMAKALGTRVQIRTFLLRMHSDKDFYLEACRDSDLAICKFENQTDKQRQYLYRVQMETDAKQYDIALEYLYRAVGIGEFLQGDSAEDQESAAQENDLVQSRYQNASGKNEEIRREANLRKLWKEAEKYSPFAVCAYIRLMAEGAISGWPLAKALYSRVSDSQLLPSLRNEGKLYHPIEIVFWKMGTFQSLNNMFQASMDNYTKAVEICFADTDIALKIIGLAVEMEQYSVMLREQGGKGRKIPNLPAKKRSLSNHYAEIRKSDSSGILERIWKDIDFESRDAEYFWKESRKVTY